jgi:leucyl/phenylalanyl-tRNA--protein transferase
MIPWLRPGDPFPPVERALAEPSGLLAAGADLSPATLLEAYCHGIFPWYSAGEPILWWSPDPRMVLDPRRVKISRSLARRLRNADYEVRLDSAFDRVVLACAQPRAGQHGTWIVPEMRAAYGELHRIGYAHSVETWMDGELAGGLYGVAIGRAFYGESMFSRATDASKIALAHLARYLDLHGFAGIDCQMSTPHLASLGAREVPRDEFVAALSEWVRQPGAAGRWPQDGARALFRAEGAGHA